MAHDPNICQSCGGTGADRNPLNDPGPCPECGPRAKDVSYALAQDAVMYPDLYGGPNCDKLVPGWRVGAPGEDEDDIGGTLTLSARTFPPGTKVIVQEPVCPDCGERRSVKHPVPTRGPIYGGPCDCGFDWEAWVAEQFS